MTGMLGVYMTAAELTKRGFIVSPTSRSAIGADLLVTDQQCKRAWSIQVKTNAKRAGFWLCSKNAFDLKSRSHIYVFVNAQNGVVKAKAPEFFVVPSVIVAQKLRQERHGAGSTWYSFYLKENEKYRDGWDKVFGKSSHAQFSDLPG
jgi:hypothetical protein